MKINRDLSFEFKIFYQHVHSLNNKKSVLEIILDEISPKFVVLVVEHNLKNFETEILTLSNFVLVSSFYWVYYEWGGVAIYSQ